MQNLLHITCVQLEVSWENITENLSKIEGLVAGIESDLIVLPEMFSTGFSMQPERCAENMDGSSVSWMKEIALEKNIAVMGSLIIVENNNYYNRLVFVHPLGKIEYYDKRHLFTLAGEEKVYTAGKEKLIVEYLGWKICPMICYDLRFPVWSRNNEGYDLLVYVANWPKPRVLAWDSLLKSRAIENLCYSVGVNRIGADENNLEYIGHTQCNDMLGEFIANPIVGKECILQFTLNKETLTAVRNKFQFLNDKDSFIIAK